MSKMPVLSSGLGPGQPSVQISNQLQPQVGRPYRTLWEFIVLHHLVRGAKELICGRCRAIIIDLAASQFTKRGCPLPSGVNRTFLDNLGTSQTLRDFQCRAIANIIRQQGVFWKASRPDQFRHVLHAQWMTGMSEEFAAKLMFACQHSYTLMDLHRNRPFAAESSPTSYINNFKRYIVAVANPCLGLKCTCRGSNWYPKPGILAKYKFDEETASIIADGPGDWLVELEMSCHITDRRYHLAEEIRTVLENNTPNHLQFNDFMSPIWHSITVQSQLRPHAIKGGSQWADSVNAARQKLDHMYKTFAVAVSTSPDLKGFSFAKCIKCLEFQVEIKSCKTVQHPDLVKMVLENEPWDGPDQGTPGGKACQQGAAREIFDCLAFLTACANQKRPGVPT